jgi:hypothetical protein
MSLPLNRLYKRYYLAGAQDFVFLILLLLYLFVQKNSASVICHVPKKSISQIREHL